MGDGCTRVRVTMKNEGFLPSYACNQGAIHAIIHDKLMDLC